MYFILRPSRDLIRLINSPYELNPLVLEMSDEVKEVSDDWYRPSR